MGGALPPIMETPDDGRWNALLHANPIRFALVFVDQGGNFSPFPSLPLLLHWGRRCLLTVHLHVTCSETLPTHQLEVRMPQLDRDGWACRRPVFDEWWDDKFRPGCDSDLSSVCLDLSPFVG